MDLKKLVNMDMNSAIDWLIDNHDKYILVEKKHEKKRGLEMAEQQLLGYHAAKSGERLAMLVVSMGLTIKEYVTMLNEGIIEYLTDSEKAEILSAVKITKQNTNPGA